jgi:protein ImuB
MSRIVSVWLPRWPIQRFLAAQLKNPSDTPVDPGHPFVLVVTVPGGPHISALNAAAEAEGLRVGEPLADARAKTDQLQVRTLDSGADDTALRKLALWATRYSPTASAWGGENGSDGFFLDIEGAAHLFGGEESLLADLAVRLEKNFGLTARLAVADTPGAAWALAHFHEEPCIALPSGSEAQTLAAFPVEALRLTPDTLRTLRRLGFKTIGMLLDKPRAPFAARFSADLLWRIDQALGHVHEPLVPVIAPPVYHTVRYLLEPIITQQAIVALARRLMKTLTHVLARDDVGARALRLSLYRIDGAVETIAVALTLPTRDIALLSRLMDLKLEALAATEDAGFGFEAVGLAITHAETIPTRQRELLAEAVNDGDRSERCAILVDTIRQRLGSQSVRRFAPIARHIPEASEILEPFSSKTPASWDEVEHKTRPLLLLPCAEPAEDVIAVIPDGPPRRFRWRGVTHEVKVSEGPERIASEWWRLDFPHSRESGKPASNGEEKPGSGWQPSALTRDYYRVEDAHGRRFWLYRQGLHERETADARWFVHGLFA